MPNFQRSTWTAVFFVALLAPFGIIYMLSLIAQPTKTATGRPNDTQAATQTASQPAHPLLGPPAPPPPARVAAIFAAGDEKTLWVAHPLVFDPTGKKLPAFELLRARNARTWTLIRDADNNPYFQDYPRGLAAFSQNPATKFRAVPYVFNRAGTVQSFFINSSTLQENLPPDHTLIATAGSANGIFAITAGAPVPGSGKTGDILDLLRLSAPTPFTQPATTTSQPAAATSGPAPIALVNAYWLKDSHWIILPPLGESSADPATGVPSSAALVALAQQADRLIALWVEPANPGTLVMRSLEFKAKTPAWSVPATSLLPNPVPPDSRLLPVLLDQTLYLFWPAPAPGSRTLELRGGRLSANSADPLPAKNFLPPLSLKAAGEGLNPAADISLGPAENSIAVIVNTRENSLVSLLFNDRGELTAGPLPVEPQTPRRDTQFAQNIAILVLVLMLTLSFWQWRHRAGAVKLPPGMIIAKPFTRAVAFFIDMALPYFLVVLFFRLWENDGYSNLILTAANSVYNFDILFASPPLLALLAIYLVHVTVGELFFRRSIGKALTGLEILMVDGKPPTVAAILVRNLIRLPELLLGLLVIYMFISRNRQRLGDVVARTLVISHEPPDEAATPDDD